MSIIDVDQAVALIPLRNHAGQVHAYALIDVADEPLVSRWSWRMHSGGYAARNLRVGARQHTCFLHRQILGLAPSDTGQVDHINRNKLDCRRANLRVVTPSENQRNSVRYDLGGVSWHPQRQKWWARVTLPDGRRVSFGLHDTKQAARAAVERGRRIHGVGPMFDPADDYQLAAP